MGKSRCGIISIVGRPNVGKSTLLNALLREERAMVSDIPGTTRDVIEEVLNIDGIRFRFLDTAGMRETQDPLERMGIERTHSSIARARIVLWMADAADFLARPEKYARPPFEVTGEQTVHLLLNKADRLCAEESARAKSLDGVTPLSAKTGDNVMAVTTLLSSTLADAGNGGESTIITSERHHEALRHAATAITRARRALRDGLTADLLAEELRGSLHHLGTITGEITTDEVLGEIFSKFCIGK